MSLVSSIRDGLRVGLRSGLDADGFFQQGATKKAALIFLQSNALGPGTGVAQEAIEVGISNDYPNVKITRRSANNIGPPPTFVAEGPEDLQPATVFVGVNFPIDHAGIELKLGRALDALDPNEWGIIIMAINGSGLHDEWNNPAYPGGGELPLLTQLVNEIDARLVAMDAYLELVVPIGLESDSGESPDVTSVRTNFESVVVQRLGNRYGPFFTVIPRLSHHSAAGGSIPTAIAGTFDFANANARI
mgnify:FL=1